MDETENRSLGIHVRKYGRCDEPARQWVQAIILGTIAALFVAPLFGFPMLSQGQHYLGFVGGIAGLAVAFALVVKKLRMNCAVKLYERGVVVVKGREEAILLFCDLRYVNYHRKSGRLIFGTKAGEDVSLRFELSLGASVVRALGPQLDVSSASQPKSTPA
ncbi:MAG: hypothetical protein KTR25_07965 [Myxococcales bacterium]|nr:hypothetical protein [Myxococcales bacterium]